MHFPPAKQLATEVLDRVDAPQVAPAWAHKRSKRVMAELGDRWRHESSRFGRHFQDFHKRPREIVVKVHADEVHDLGVGDRAVVVSQVKADLRELGFDPTVEVFTKNERYKKPRDLLLVQLRVPVPDPIESDPPEPAKTPNQLPSAAVASRELAHLKDGTPSHLLPLAHEILRDLSAQRDRAFALFANELRGATTLPKEVEFVGATGRRFGRRLGRLSIDDRKLIGFEIERQLKSLGYTPEITHDEEASLFRFHCFIHVRLSVPLSEAEQLQPRNST